jgi:hypothetical protein
MFAESALASRVTRSRSIELPPRLASAMRFSLRVRTRI